MEGQAKSAAYLTSTCFPLKLPKVVAMLQVSAICLTACFDDELLDLLLLVVVVIIASVVTAS